MSTFSQWWLSFTKNQTPRQVTWVCGSEPILVDEVVSLIKYALPVDDINTVYIDARNITERKLWNDLRELPFGSNVLKLTIVRAAENVKSGDKFQQYIKDKGALPRNYVVFVSSEDFLRREENNSLWEPLEYLKTRGSLIECRPFTANTAKHAVTWVKNKININGRVAEFLLNRATGDLRLVRDTMAKLSVFPGEPNMRAISEMMEERPDDSFLGALFSLDKKTALAALREIPREQYSKTLGLIDARLDLAGLVHDMLIEHKSSGEIAKAAGNKAFLVPDMLPIAKHYNKKRRLRIRKILALLDGYSDVGIPDGGLESLVVLW